MLVDDIRLTAQRSLFGPGDLKTMAYNMHYVMEKWLVQSLDTVTSDAMLTWLVIKTYYTVRHAVGTLA